MTIVVAAGPLLPGVAEASLGDQAHRGASASPASREHRRDAPSPAFAAAARPDPGRGLESAGRGRARHADSNAQGVVFTPAGSIVSA